LLHKVHLVAVCVVDVRWPHDRSTQHLGWISGQGETVEAKGDLNAGRKGGEIRNRFPVWLRPL
jgi:hypothetical protein